MGIKYIRNTDDATIVCKIPSDKNKAYIFRPKKVDKRNSIILSNGYTEISDEDIAILRAESSTFKFYENAGKLTVGDNLPQESMSPEQLVAALKNENAILKRQLKEVQSNSSSEGDQTALQDALAKIEEQEKALVAAHEEIADQKRMIEGLDEQLAAMADEVNSAPRVAVD